MASKISQADLSSAASAALSRKMSPSSRGTREDMDQEEWNKLRARACQLFLSDPDARVYAHYLASNKLAARLRIFHALLCECVVLLESSSSGFSETATSTKEKKENFRRLVTDMRSASTTFSIGRLTASAASYLTALTKDFSRSKRLERGPATPSALKELADELPGRATEIVYLFVGLTSLSWALGAILSGGATSTVLPGLEAVLRQELSPKAEALSVSGSVGAMRAFSRPCSASHLVHMSKAFPEPLSVKNTGAVLTFVGPTGAVLDPRMLGVSVGNVVLSGTHLANVTSVSALGISIDADIPVEDGIRVQTPAQVSLTALVDGLRGFSTGMILEAARTLKKPSMRNISRPEAKKLAGSLVKAALHLAPLTSECQRSCAVLGIDLAESDDYLGMIRRFDPGVASSSVKAVDEILSLAKGLGLDEVEDRICSADLSVLSEESVYECRKSTTVSYSVGQYMSSLQLSTTL